MHLSALKKPTSHYHAIMLMIARGFKSYVPFLKRNGNRAVVNVNQHGGGYVCCCRWKIRMRILLKGEGTCIKYASFVVCCQTTSFAVHRQYTTCTCTKMNKII